MHPGRWLVGGVSIFSANISAALLPGFVGSGVSWAAFSRVLEVKRGSTGASEGNVARSFPAMRSGDGLELVLRIADSSTLRVVRGIERELHT